MKKILISLMAASSLFAGAISVENAWVKATPATAKNSAIFMQIKNSSDKDIKLIDAHSEFAANTEIHTHIHEDGMMKMIRIKDATVPAGSVLELKPKSFHVMLFNIKEQIKEDSKVNVELKFDDGESIKLDNIPVKAIKGAHNEHHNHGEHENH